MARPRAMSTVRAPQHCAPSRASDVAQRRIALALGLVADDVFLAEPLGADDDVAGHSDQVREAPLGAPEIGDAEPQEQRDDAEAEQEARQVERGSRRRGCTSGSRR